MSKLIENEQSPQVLKICAGNDFALRIYCSQWDKDANEGTGDWVNFDLNDANDLQFYLVSQQFKRILLPYVLQNDGAIIVDIAANYLQQTTYGIEMTWMSKSKKSRRTYTPIMIQIVRTTEEAQTDLEEYENSVYNLNVKITSDIDLIKIGGRTIDTDDTTDLVTLSYLMQNYYDKDAIDDNYYDMREVNIILSSYVTNSYLESALESFESELAGEFVDNSELAESLSYYATTDDLNETLNSYVSHEQLNEMCYITINDVPEIDTSDLVSYEALQAMGYITINDVPEVDTSEFVSYAYLNNQNFVTAGQIGDLGYVTQSQINSMSYATQNFVEQSINAIDIPDVSNLVSNSTLESVLQSYITEGELNTRLNNASYATTGDLANTYNDLKSYVNTQIDAIDYSAYVTKTDLSAMSYVDQTSLSNMSYAPKSYVDSKVEGLVSYNALNAMSYATTDNVSSAVDGLVSYSALNAMSYATTDNVSSAVDGLVSYSALQSMSYATTSDVSTAINNIDMSSYITSDELDAMGYITADDIPELPDVSGFVTNQQLSNMSYVTSSALSNMGYITAQDVPSQDMSAYVTHTELNNASYITTNDLPDTSGLVSYTALDSMGYLTNGDVSAMGYITSSDLPDTSGLVSYSALNAMSYTSESYVSSNYAKKTDVPVNGIKFVNDSPIAVSYLWAGTNAELAQVSPRDNNTLYITTDDATTYVDLTPYALKSETAKVVTLTQDQYNALIATGPVDEYTIYLIIEQQ